MPSASETLSNYRRKAQTATDALMEGFEQRTRSRTLGGGKGGEGQGPPTSAQAESDVASRKWRQGIADEQEIFDAQMAEENRKRTRGATLK